LKLKTKLSTSMTSTQFDNGYWYATELKDFAERIGIPSASKLRKDELERAIKVFLQTYRDWVREYVRLSQTAGPFAQVPHGRYINFMSDFMAAEQSATREQATRAWTTLKALDVPKDYRSWKRFRSSKGKQ